VSKSKFPIRHCADIIRPRLANDKSDLLIHARVGSRQSCRSEEPVAPAITLNEAEVEPSGIITLAGTLASVALELESVAVTPPVPAAAVRVTVPVAV
jgi:hypothetical protein